VQEYNLDPGEFVIMQESPAKLHSGSGTDDLDEVVLTNRHLILVCSQSQGLFGKKRLLKRCPLEHALDSQGYAQVVTTKIDGNNILQVLFNGENVSVSFPNKAKQTVERWADGIRNAAVGDLGAVKTEDAIPNEFADAVDNAKNVVGAIFGKKKSAPTAPTRPAPRAAVAKKCQGCHAPLTGRTGDTVTCMYCDTKQTLQ
jgi:hypothetical protein